MRKIKITEILKETFLKASDLHLIIGRPPMFRIDGALIASDHKVLTPDDILIIADEILTTEQRKTFDQYGEIDFSYSIKGTARFRVNFYKQRGTMGAAFRAIQINIPSIKDLNLPDTVANFSKENKGLILVTGATGSGKSTTLASIVNLINKTKAKLILTLEDPIEFLFRHDKSLIVQREVGLDSTSFARALRAALRQDIDVLLVGEMRDPESIEIAITAAETGHVVLSSLHTINVYQAIDRIIDVFPANKQQQIKIQLANSLVGIMCQQLIPKIGGGRIAAIEILVANTAIRNLIREGKTFQIKSILQTGGKAGMITMDDSIYNLYKERHITEENAITHAFDRKEMEERIRHNAF